MKYDVENQFNYKKEGNIIFTLSCKLNQLFSLKSLLQPHQRYQKLFFHKMFIVAKN